MHDLSAAMRSLRSEKGLVGGFVDPCLGRSSPAFGCRRVLPDILCTGVGASGPLGLNNLLRLSRSGRQGWRTTSCRAATASRGVWAGTAARPRAVRGWRTGLAVEARPPISSTSIVPPPARSIPSPRGSSRAQRAATSHAKRSSAAPFATARRSPAIAWPNAAIFSAPSAASS